MLALEGVPNGFRFISAMISRRHNQAENHQFCPYFCVWQKLPVFYTAILHLTHKKILSSMGVMEKFRDSAKYIMYLLILSFGVLWALADTQVFDAMMAGPRSLGTVNGEAISFEMFNNRMEFYNERYRDQTGNSPNAELRAYYEEAAWNDLVTALVMKQEMENLGISVSDQELVDMVTGPNPDPFIAQQFTDETGRIDRVALQTAIESPENREAWIMVESQLRDKRQQEKLNAYLESGFVASEAEIEQQFINKNTSADVEFVRFPVADIADSLVSVSNADLQAYYKKNQARYKQKKTWRFSYIEFDTTPTAQDTALIVNEMEELRFRFANAGNDSTFLIQYSSDARYSGAYVAKGDIKSEFAPLFDLKKGEVSAPIKEGGMIHLLKLVDVKGKGDKAEYKFADFARTVVADPFGTIETQSQAADDFMYFALEDGFETEAEKSGHAVLNGVMTEGNPFVPGLGQSRQILAFLEKSDVGAISEPIEMTNKIVVVKVDQFTPEGFRPFEEVKEQVERAVKIEKRKEMLLEKVKAAFSGDDLNALAESMGKEVQTANAIRKDASVLVGGGREPKIIGHIFAAEEGSSIGPIIGEAGVYVVKVNKKTAADLANLNAAEKNQIRQQIVQEKNQRVTRVWVDQLMAQAEIEDFRRLVLR